MQVSDCFVKPYQPGQELKNFPNIYTNLDKEFDYVYDMIPSFSHPPHSRLFVELGRKVVFKDIFYYIDMLYDNTPNTVIDVGCGLCTWKKWFPGIIGFDAESSIPESLLDFEDYFDKGFSKVNEKKYDCGLAINSLHYCAWELLPTNIHYAMNVVKDRFLFTVDFEAINSLPKDRTRFDLIVDLFELLITMPYNIIMFDSLAGRNLPAHIDKWSSVNGMVRFILEHKHV